MTFVMLAIGFLILCAGVGLARGSHGSTALLAAFLAAAMTCVQFALLMTW